jgi:hypothetical protein
MDGLVRVPLPIVRERSEIFGKGWQLKKTFTVEVENDFLDDSVHMIQRGENLFPAHRRWLSEGYLNSKLHIIVHLRDRQGTQFAAIFNRSIRVDERSHHYPRVFTTKGRT